MRNFFLNNNLFFTNSFNVNAIYMFCQFEWYKINIKYIL